MAETCGSRKNKVGIITLDGNFNYGNRLQLYATTQIYKGLGFQAENLVLNSRKPASLIDLLLSALSPSGDAAPQSFSSGERLAAFEDFNSSIPRRLINSIREIDIDEYDWFSVGSDQVWNPGAVRDRSKASLFGRPILTVRDKQWSNYLVNWFFLGFCRPAQRIALSPSIGIDDVDSAQRELLRRGLSNFKFVSVREERGADIIFDITGIRPTVICDPTLVISASVWRSISNDRLNPSAPYILTYLLGGMSKEAKAAIDMVNHDGALSVVSLSDRQKQGEPDAGPAEFISLIDNAAHVITDSFHSAVFSSILETPLTIVHREGGSTMFSRLDSLTKSLGIKHMIFDSPEFDISTADDFTGVPHAIAREKQRFYSYLNRQLSLK